MLLSPCSLNDCGEDVPTEVEPYLKWTQDICPSRPLRRGCFCLSALCFTLRRLLLQLNSIPGIALGPCKFTWLVIPEPTATASASFLLRDHLDHVNLPGSDTWILTPSVFFILLCNVWKGQGKFSFCESNWRVFVINTLHRSVLRKQKNHVG